MDILIQDLPVILGMELRDQAQQLREQEQGVVSPFPLPILLLMVEPVIVHRIILAPGPMEVIKEQLPLPSPTVVPTQTARVRDGFPAFG